MKKLILTAAAFMVAVAAYGQGQFLFNTRNIGAGNNVTFALQDGSKVSGADYFVEVLAGTSAANLAPLTPTLPLNRTGSGAGYPNPFGGTYNAPAGTTLIGYRAYQGSSFAGATVKSDTITVNQMLDANNAPVALSLPTDPTTPPPELFLGVKTVTLAGGNVPEPSTLALGLLGVGALLALRRRS